MRRKDREITDMEEILQIIKKCSVCRLGLFDKDFPYVVPLNFGYEYKDSVLTLFFHGAKEGKKLDLIQADNRASFEMDCSHKLIPGEMACDYTMEYESVMGQGFVEILPKEEKVSALNALMQKYTKGKEFQYRDSDLDEVEVFKLTVKQITGKRLQK